ncbi:hypothetical protein RXV86_16040 [Alisedimentitalea sp. MJ-SS2]|uniref:hypothetical protein n=1 Tax=Aliisedimentitalea sp. MJ-SS2 TaxID=3049795 RepID=UPI0029145229|nr:hypothetical protein [Alisedimentitalea sp. MJ-SS2]MDU8928904.1 hypothetical protein [Alisedimentitalea sp. MJ-SS2]
MKKLLTAAAISLAAFSVQADEQKQLVTILTDAEPQTQLMAMVLTMQAAKQGAAAHVLLCDSAGDLALKDAPESATQGQPPKGMSPQGLMKKIIGMPNAKVEVCAIYLPATGAEKDVLLDGIGVAKPGEMAASVLAADASMSF